MVKLRLQIYQSLFSWMFCLLLMSISMLQWTMGSGMSGAYIKRIKCIFLKDVDPSIEFTKKVSSVINCATHCTDKSVSFFFHKIDKHCACVNNIEQLQLPSSDVCSDPTAEVSVYFKNDGFGATTCYGKRSMDKPIRILSDGMFVLCDTVTDNGGWIIVQRRTSAEVDFYRGWDAYVHGFGSLGGGGGGFWFGLDRIHRLCSNKCQMRFDFTYQDTSYWAVYDVTIDGPSDKYRFHILGGYTGNAGDSLRGTNPKSTANGMMFTTKDQDNDRKSKNCAVLYHTAWWLNNCHNMNPNGIWGSREFGKGVIWVTTTGLEASVQSFEIKVRPLGLSGQ